MVDIDGLAKRIELLENQNRRLKRLGFACCVAFCALFIIGQMPTKPTAGNGVATVTVADRFAVQGKDRFPYSEWMIFSEGTMMFTMVDKESRLRLMLGIEGDGSPFLKMYGKDKKVIAHLP